MTAKTLIRVIAMGLIALQSSFAATIPAGTTLIVRTLGTIHSNDRVGRTFAAQLDQDVAVNGNVVLPAGTKVRGRIEVSQNNLRESRPLTLNLTDISLNGRTIPVKTVSGFQVKNKARSGARRGSISVGPYLVQPGTKMEFRLAQPLNL
jgi:hypothetical protein